MSEDTLIAEEGTAEEGIADERRATGWDLVRDYFEEHDRTCLVQQGWEPSGGGAYLFRGLGWSARLSAARDDGGYFARTLQLEVGAGLPGTAMYQVTHDYTCSLSHDGVLGRYWTSSSLASMARDWEAWLVAKMGDPLFLSKIAQNVVVWCVGGRGRYKLEGRRNEIVVRYGGIGSADSFRVWITRETGIIETTSTPPPLNMTASPWGLSARLALRSSVFGLAARGDAGKGMSVFNTIGAPPTMRAAVRTPSADQWAYALITYLRQLDRLFDPKAKNAWPSRSVVDIAGELVRQCVGRLDQQVFSNTYQQERRLHYGSIES